MPQALAGALPAAWPAQRLPSLLRPSCARPSALAVLAGLVHAASWLRPASCSPPRSPLCLPAECMRKFSMPCKAIRSSRACSLSCQAICSLLRLQSAPSAERRRRSQPIQKCPEIPLKIMGLGQTMNNRWSAPPTQLRFAISTRTIGRAVRDQSNGLGGGGHRKAMLCTVSRTRRAKTWLHAYTAAAKGQLDDKQKPSVALLQWCKGTRSIIWKRVPVGFKT